MRDRGRRGAEAGGGQRAEITTAEAAVLIGVTPSRVRQFISARRLAARRFGRDWLLRRADAAAFARKPRHRTGRPKKVLART